jgi:hypothetical protein
MNRHMKTATLIALVCSVVLYSSPLRIRETKPDFSPDRMERKLDVAGESPGKAVAKSAADDEKAHFLKRQTANRNTVIAFGVFASALGLLLLSELLRAPQGYKGDVGFHFGKPFRNSRSRVVRFDVSRVAPGPMICRHWAADRDMRRRAPSATLLISTSMVDLSADIILF